MMKYILTLFFLMNASTLSYSQDLSERVDFVERSQNANLIDMPLQQYWVGHLRNDEMRITYVREPETCCYYWTKFCTGVVFAGAVANGMIPVFLEYVSKNTPDVSYNLTLAMIATGVVYGTECLVNFLEKKEDETNLQWKVTAAISSILPVYYLFSVENSHHEAAKNTGWDEYYTFCAALALPLALNQYLSLLNFGNEYYREFSENSRYGILEKTLDLMSEAEVRMVYAHIVKKHEKEIPLPKTQVSEDFEKEWIAECLCFTIVFSAPSIPAFYMLWRETLPSVISSPYDEIATGLLTAISFGSATNLNLYCTRSFECTDLLCLAFGIAKSIPFLVLTDASVSEYPSITRHTLMVFASIFPILEESGKSRKTIKNILKRIPYFQDNDWYRREFLKENLL